MLVTVDEDGRAVEIDGDPEHPITDGFLCGKVSNYLDRVYSDERLLHPLIRNGPKGSAEFRRASWEEAIDVAARGLERRSPPTGRSRSSPTATWAPRGRFRAARWRTGS